MGRFLSEALVVTVVLCLGLWLRGAHWSTWGYLTGIGLMALAVILPPGTASQRRKSAGTIGIGVFLLTLAVRMGSAEGTDLKAQTLVRIPGEAGVAPGSTALVNRTFSERDLAIAGAQILIGTGRLPASDSEGFIDALSLAYQRMEDAEGTVLTPIGLTYLHRQRASEFDALLLESDVPSTKAVVFLHGFAGNYAVQCWHMALAARPSALTICPSVGFHGAWWEPQGAATLETTLTYLRSRGYRTVILAGLSNGARGTAVLARRFRRELDGVIVISGAAAVAPPPVPVLALQGERDTMFSPGVARGYARRAGRRGRYVGIDTGHFMFLDRVDLVQPPLREFIAGIDSERFGRAEGR
ncbi:MAG: alpha/beta hydrolase [Myxococcota bacterium]